MPARWTTSSVLELAPDVASQRAAARLAGSSSWGGAGTAGDLVWGRCAGSGKDPYQVVVDLAGPAYRCSCPSRKFPCKHALGLLLRWADGAVPEQAEAADYAQAWVAGRVARARTAGSPRAKAENAAGSARRSRQRARRVAAGLAELQRWLRDQVRTGLSGAAGAGYRDAEAIAARMVDAQAPGVAGALRRLPGIPVSGEGWPGRLLGEYAQLHLLTRAYEQFDALPPGLASVVRSRVGYTISREDVLSGPAVTDCWRVLAVRDLVDGPVPGRRAWLRGRDHGRFALLLSFAPNGNFGENADAALTPGAELHADLHFYPGQPPLRAVTGTRHGRPDPAGCPESAGGVTGLLDEWAAALEQDPWLTEWPALLTGTPAAAGDEHFLVDSSGLAVPLVGTAPAWTLLAVSGGKPVTVAGEWGPAGLTALTTWHCGRVVRL